MITVTFLNGCILATAEQSLWQYSYNQKLQIVGLELPEVFTVDFCNEGDTTTVAMIGSSDVVDIPNELLTSGRGIVAYVFQKSALTGGVTRCEIRIDVLTRPERDDETPTPEQEAVIDQYIAELNEGVENAETAAANAQTSEDNAAASAADAQQSKEDAAASASAAAGSASDASNSAAAAAQSAVNASNSAENAAEAASEGIGYKEDSEAWAIGKRGGVDVGSSDETYHNNSKYYASQAAASSSAANSEAAAAAQSARDAAASANGAAQSAASATASKNAAANSADIAANAATAAQNHAISAASSATAAGGSATAAANKATAAAQSATAAGNSATEAATAREAAEDAQDAAEAAAQSIAQSAAQIAQNTSDIGDLTSQINTLQPAATAADIGKALIVKTVADGKPTEYEYGEAGGGGDATNYAPIIINSASGDIASFADGADDLPVKALTVAVEPIQDLHGYDNPWPAGGGKNKIPYPYYTADGTVSGVAFSTASDGKITATGTTDAGLNYFLAKDMILNAGTYTVSVSGTHTALTLIARDPVNNVILGDVTPAETSATFTISETTSVRLYFNTTVVGASVNISAYVQLETGNQPTSWSPYSNICPISGRTSATVTRTGKNLLKPQMAQGTSSIVALGQSDATSFGTFLKAGTYTISVQSSKSFAFYYRAENGTKNVHIGGYNVTSATFTLTEDLRIRLYAYLNTGLSVSDISNPQLELGSTASAYEPYQGNSYTIQLGDTVYGGKLNVTQGKMVVDRAMKVFSGALSEGWAKSDYAYFVTNRITDAINRNATPSDFQSNLFPYGSISNNTSTLGGCLIWANIRVRLADMSISLDDWKAQLASNPMQVVYTLATPFEITLTPTQIETLLGTNNIWADAGPVDVDYRADTKLYIDNIHQPTEDDMTADAQIASGKYFLIGGNLYKSTTVIPAGDTIIPGTNCIKTNLAEALNALNA